MVYLDPKPSANSGTVAGDKLKVPAGTEWGTFLNRGITLPTKLWTETARIHDDQSPK